MSEITVVTAFFDIGRGEWVEKLQAHDYLHRTTDTYFERFGRLAELVNDLVVFTSEDLKDRVLEARNGRPTQVVTLEFEREFKDLRERISKVQSSYSYKTKINGTQIQNPEYWNPDYVIVNAMKPFYVRKSLDAGIIKTPLAAWVDFGYCRDDRAMNGAKSWKYDFDPEKIHLFTVEEYDGRPIINVISDNVVFTSGPCIVAGHERWRELEKLVMESIEWMLSNNLIDDDQTMLLWSWLKSPNSFQLHPINPWDWFVVFREFNQD